MYEKCNVNDLGGNIRKNRASASLKMTRPSTDHYRPT
jgi:hypothetical protein